MLKEVRHKNFSNGSVYALKTADEYPIETTDTFLPYYTKNALGEKTNALTSYDLGSRKERWMIGVSCMSGCPIKCKFCATGKLKKWRNLTSDEIVEQVKFIIEKNPNFKFNEAQEHKINYTRMGEPGLNLDEVKGAIEKIEKLYPNTHHYVSTIGIKNADFKWVKGNITLQISVHSLDDKRRNELIPYKNKMTISELGKIRTNSNLKTTLNMTLVDESDFDIVKLKENFNTDNFFIKLSPINKNDISVANNLGSGIIHQGNKL